MGSWDSKCNVVIPATQAPDPDVYLPHMCGEAADICDLRDPNAFCIPASSTHSICWCWSKVWCQKAVNQDKVSFSCSIRLLFQPRLNCVSLSVYTVKHTVFKQAALSEPTSDFIFLISCDSCTGGTRHTASLKRPLTKHICIQCLITPE